MATGPIEPFTLSIKETAGVLRLSERKVYYLISQGELEKLKIGTRAVVTVESIRRYLDRLRNPPQSPKRQ